MPVVSRERAHVAYLDAQYRAIASTVESLGRLVPDAEMTIREISSKIDVAWQKQWKGSGRLPPDGGWDWPVKRTQYTFNSAIKLAMWCRKEAILSGLMLGRLNNTACVIDYLEGSPDDAHPLKGKVTLFGLDVAARYAQETGRREVWIKNPANDVLIDLYARAYGFEYVKPRQGGPYCRKAV